jgi:hypothetical protein
MVVFKIIDSWVISLKECFKHVHELKFQQLKISMQVICCFVILNRFPNKRKHICKMSSNILKVWL